ncbi:hypothetical protein PGB90_000523 [Kerria lacca]
MNFENVFVTVGTTKFDKLIHTIINEKTLKILKKRGCKSLTIQIGNGTIIPVIYDSEISLKYYRYKDSICSDIFKADLIISHAGAGTCIDVLEYKKPLITVINDDLMHNHQTELACKLSEEGYCICCTSNELLMVTDSKDQSSAVSFSSSSTSLIIILLERIFKHL